MAVLSVLFHAIEQVTVPKGAKALPVMDSPHSAPSAADVPYTMPYRPYRRSKSPKPQTKPNSVWYVEPEEEVTQYQLDEDAEWDWYYNEYLESLSDSE